MRSCFFHLYRAHPALPSFPTRRSSDLADAELDRRGNERRITDSPGPAAEPALARVGDGVLLAWAGDPLTTGRTDVFVRVLDADRKSTRLNSSHLGISYAVFCLKKKQQQ